MLGELRSVHSSADAAALLSGLGLAAAGGAWLKLPTHPAPPSPGGTNPECGISEGWHCSVCHLLAQLGWKPEAESGTLSNPAARNV